VTPIIYYWDRETLYTEAGRPVVFPITLSKACEMATEDGAIVRKGLPQ
jgi:hypothetical protein